MGPTYLLAPIANFLGCVLVLLPLFCTSIRSGTWNIAVTSFTLWIAVQCITTGVNAILWSDNIWDLAPVWCDITTHLNYAARIALRACTFLMTRSLYDISLCRNNSYVLMVRKNSAGVSAATDNNIIPARCIAQKHNKLPTIFQFGCTLGLPLLTMLLYYVVQKHRFEIVEEQGCVHAPDVSGFSILFIEIPNLLLPMISALFYCPRIFWSTYKRRKDINSNMFEGSKVSRGIYSRVMALGCVEALFTLPVSIYMFISDIQPLPRVFYPGWKAVHANFSTIPTTPASEWSKDAWLTINVRWALWTNPVIAFAFFALFGLTGEARITYLKVFWAVMRPFGMKEPPTRNVTSFESSEMQFRTHDDRGIVLNSSILTDD